MRPTRLPYTLAFDLPSGIARAVTALAVAVLLGLASRPAAGASSTEVCTLLSPAAIGAATGHTWGDGVPNELLSGPGRAVCDWYNAGGEYAAVQVMIFDNASVFESNRDSAGEVFGLAPEGVSIAGADAVYATAEGSLIGMRIRGLFAQVSYIPPGPGNVLGATLRLAQSVAERL